MIFTSQCFLLVSLVKIFRKNKAVYTAYVAPRRPKSESVTESITDGPTDRRTDTCSH